MKTFALHGMTCEKCVARVQTALQGLLPDCSVTLNPPRLHIRQDPQVGTADLVVINTALANAGAYSATVLGAEIKAPWHKTYRAVLLILIYAAVLAWLFSSSFHGWMMYFMGGYFLAFSLFKLLDVQGFAASFARYNPIAARSRAFALVYPVIELALGLAYLTGIAVTTANLLVLALYSLNAAGVAHALRQGRVLKCACLGTAISMPVGRVTLAEDLGMVAMALFMLAGIH